MRLIYERILALVILCIPGFGAVYGWTLLRESLFNLFAGETFNLYNFIGGGMLFFIGLALVAGFIFHRDKKKNMIQPKLLRNKKNNDER